ncbi:hypothetical protein ACDJ24_09515 [Klebsiella pneumoniae]
MAYSASIAGLDRSVGAMTASMIISTPWRRAGWYAMMQAQEYHLHHTSSAAAGAFRPGDAPVDPEGSQPELDLARSAWRLAWRPAREATL